MNIQINDNFDDDEHIPPSSLPKTLTNPPEPTDGGGLLAPIKEEENGN